MHKYANQNMQKYANNIQNMHVSMLMQVSMTLYVDAYVVTQVSISFILPKNEALHSWREFFYSMSFSTSLQQPLFREKSNYISM